MDVQDELLKPPDQAPLAAEAIYKDFPTLIGGPYHGEPVPVWALNKNHVELIVPVKQAIRYVDEPVDAIGPRIDRVMYVRGKFASTGSRRVLNVWCFSDLAEDERSALTWHAILERAALT